MRYRAEKIVFEDIEDIEIEFYLQNDRIIHLIVRIKTLKNLKNIPPKLVLRVLRLLRRGFHDGK